MAIKTVTEQLEEVQAAITKVLEAQEAGIGDKRILRARLGALEAREKRLLNLYRQEQEGGFTNKVEFTRPL